MAPLFVVVVVLYNDTVLLTQREDFAVWCLPGGLVETHESLDAAVMRELFEETGVQVEISHLVGLLSKPNWRRDGTHTAVFAARPLTLTLKADPAEVAALGFYPLDQPPEPLLWEHHQLIEAARRSVTGAVWVNRARTPAHFADRVELYAWRDGSGPARQKDHEKMVAARIMSPGKTVKRTAHTVESKWCPAKEQVLWVLKMSILPQTRVFSGILIH
jgi:ADP-ribose pyrophosphatase YjhB (NUDIX family)